MHMQLPAALSLLVSTPLRAPQPRAQITVAPTTSLTDERLIELTKAGTSTGFYSALRPELMAKDFVFRGGVVGPLNKAD
jgi:hypothetical protein